MTTTGASLPRRSPPSRQICACLAAAGPAGCARGQKELHMMTSLCSNHSGVVSKTCIRPTKVTSCSALLTFELGFVDMLRGQTKHTAGNNIIRVMYSSPQFIRRRRRAGRKPQADRRARQSEHCEVQRKSHTSQRASPLRKEVAHGGDNDHAAEGLRRAQRLLVRLLSRRELRHAAVVVADVAELRVHGASRRGLFRRRLTRASANQ